MESVRRNNGTLSYPQLWGRLLLGLLPLAGCAEPPAHPAVRPTAQADRPTISDPSRATVAASASGGQIDGSPAPAFENRVPRVRTRLSRREMVIALARGHRVVFGREPTSERLAGAYGLCAMENDAGAALFNFNFGNVIAVQRSTLHMVQPGQDRWMRAYRSAEQGAAGFWDTVRRYHGAALFAFDAGQYATSVAALARTRYFEADAERYRTSLPLLASYALGTLIPRLRLDARAQGLSVSSLGIEPRFARAESPPVQELP